MGPKYGQSNLMIPVPTLVGFQPLDGKSHEFFGNFYIRQSQMSGWVKRSNGMRGILENSQKTKESNQKYRFEHRAKRNVVTQVDNVHQILKRHDISNRNRQ